MSDWNKYKHLRNKVNNIKKHAKETFFNTLEFTLSDISIQNPRQYWKIVKALMKENSSTCEPIPPLLNNDGNYSTSDYDKANTLNEYFTSISTVDDVGTNLPNFTSLTESSINNIEITQLEITDVLSNLVVNKASGPDEISHKMLKETSKTLCLPLSILFNRSMHENTYPCCWKKANVMPLFKKGNKDMPSNYRPISLISCVGKIMERVVFKHIYNHLITNNLIYKNQSGFLPGHSTIYQLIDIYNQICKAFDDKKSTCIVFCDISKAFDRVWHKGLMFKLRQNGIRGNLLKWLASYLINRSQRVFVGSTFSNEKKHKCGCTARLRARTFVIF